MYMGTSITSLRMDARVACNVFLSEEPGAYCNTGSFTAEGTWKMELDIISTCKGSLITGVKLKQFRHSLGIKSGVSLNPQHLSGIRIDNIATGMGVSGFPEDDAIVGNLLLVFIFPLPCLEVNDNTLAPVHQYIVRP